MIASRPCGDDTESMEGWAVTDSSGRYAVKDTREEALLEAKFLANRHGYIEGGS